ncbi:MAG: hypothetical protein OCC45_04620 [Desulfotalea sp.]
MGKLTGNLLLVAAGVALGAVGYMAIKHPEELKKVVDGAVSLGEKALGGKPEVSCADGPVVKNDNIGERDE